jgi:hypothetical protein
VALDLDTGRELLVRREAPPSAVSPDGTLAAVLLGPRPLSWRGSWAGFPARTVEIWDLAAGRLQYRGLPGESSEGPAPSLQWASWSADGTWLALADRAKWDPDGQREMRRLVLMRPDGSEVHEVSLWDTYEAAAWTWAATGRSLLWLGQDGCLIRYDPKTRQQRALWQAPRPEDMPDRAGIVDGHLSSSPDGRSIAIDMTYSFLVPSERYGATGHGPGRDYVRRLWVVSSEGEEARLVETPDTLNAGYHQVWSNDGRILYADQRVLGEDGRTPVPEVLAWNAADGTSARAILPAKEWPSEILALGTGGVLVRTSKRIWEVTPGGRALHPPEEVQRALGRGWWLGMDERGRVIVERWDPEHSAWILAVDPATGEQTPIYP